MAAKAYYPLFLDIEGRRVVVVGAGKIGFRKARGLVEAGARVVVIAPEFDPRFENLEVERVSRGYSEGDLTGAMLVFAATDNRDVNRRVGEAARALGIPVNVADAPVECAFVVPARAVVDGIHVAVSTGGTDPARAARVRSEIEMFLKEGR